jgi:multisubunit Na+/H+ antiporter MnhG subunit
MYSAANGFTVLIVSLVILIVSLVLLYYVIRAAVTEGLKAYTRWMVANRDEIERKYGKPSDGSPQSS